MDYKNGKIYMIEPTCEYDEGDVYYGSTASTLVKRLSQHKAPSNKANSKLLIEKYGRDNIKIVLMELYPCSCKDELKAGEAKYQRENKCVNKRVEGRTQKEYYEENRSQILKHKKKYNQDNRNKISENHKQYRENNRNKINEQKKEHYQANRKAVSEKRKDYYQANKEKILSQRREAYAKKKLSKLNV